LRGQVNKICYRQLQPSFQPKSQICGMPMANVAKRRLLVLLFYLGLMCLTAYVSTYSRMTLKVALIRSIMTRISVSSLLFALDVPIWLHGIQFHDLVPIILFIFFLLRNSTFTSNTNSPFHFYLKSGEVEFTLKMSEVPIP